MIMSTATKIAFTVATTWAGLAVLLFLSQRWLLYRPNTHMPDAAWRDAAGMSEIVAATEDGLSLRFWAKLPDDSSRPVVVYFHGNGGHHGDRLAVAQPLLAAGYGVVLAAYRGYGGNPGRPTEAGLYADGAATIAALAQRGVPASRLILWGESLGSGIVTMIASRTVVKGVILWAPFLSVATRAQEIYPFLPARWMTLDQFDNESRIGAIKAPLLILHGERDEVIPVHHGRRLFELAAEPKRAVFVPGLRHNDLLDERPMRAALEFVRELAAP